MSHPADVDVTPLETRITELVGVGSSGRGNSFYAGAAECGRRARLLERKHQAFAALPHALPASRHKFLVGSVYHALQQMYHTGELPDGLSSDAYAPSFRLNENLRDGWRLFTAWRNLFGAGFWGQVVATEEQIPNTAEARDAIRRHLADFAYTARIDMVVRIGVADLPRVQRRCPQISGPGLYLLDWKTRDTKGGHDAYQNGLQALTYPVLYNLQHPSEPCCGVIWDIALKHSRRKNEQPVTAADFDACSASTVLSHHDVYSVMGEIRGMVEQGARNYDMDIPNRAACVSYTGEQCQFRTSGACDAKWVA